MQHSHNQNHHQAERIKKSEFDHCLENCLNCFKVCEETLAALLIDSPKNNPNHLKLLKACADICKTSARLIILDSAFQSDLCKLCAKVCRACADSCQEVDEVGLEECILACQKCAASCTEMSKMPH